jgi:hypothetical protein
MRTVGKLTVFIIAAIVLSGAAGYAADSFEVSRDGALCIGLLAGYVWYPLADLIWDR